MIQALKDWFENNLSSDHEQASEHDLALATAVLFYEIVRADQRADAIEVQVFSERLQALHMELSQGEIDELLLTAQQQTESAADFQQFTRVINQHCSQEQKVQILQSLWLLAFADQQLDSNEEHLIRKIADLLYLSHSQFIQTKLKAQAKLAP